MSTWFKNLSTAAKAAYIKAHPNSKYAKKKSQKTRKSYSKMRATTMQIRTMTAKELKNASRNPNKKAAITRELNRRRKRAP